MTLWKNHEKARMPTLHARDCSEDDLQVFSATISVFNTDPAANMLVVFRPSSQVELGSVPQNISVRHLGRRSCSVQETVLESLF